jgi:uncharacterized protein (TIGR02145 family)
LPYAANYGLIVAVIFRKRNGGIMHNRSSQRFVHFLKYVVLSLLFFAIAAGIGCDELNEVDIPWSGADPIAPRFTDMQDGTVRDLDTGLFWLKDANAFGALSWDDAMDEAANLGDGDHGLEDGSAPGDWRLPTVEEWEEFVDRSYERPPVSNSSRNRQWSEGDPFTGIQTEASPGSDRAGAYYWSSEEESDGVAWACYMGGWGSLMANDDIMSTPQYVWPVRDGDDGS